MSKFVKFYDGGGVGEEENKAIGIPVSRDPTNVPPATSKSLGNTVVLAQFTPPPPSPLTKAYQKRYTSSHAAPIIYPTVITYSIFRTYLTMLGNNRLRKIHSTLQLNFLVFR